MTGLFYPVTDTHEYHDRQRQLQEQAARAAAVRKDAEHYRARMAEVRDAATERRSRLAEAMDDDVASGPVHMAPPPPVGIEFLVEQQIKAAASRCVCARGGERARVSCPANLLGR